MIDLPDDIALVDAVDEALALHPDPTGQVLGVLNYLQKRFRYVPDGALEELSRQTGVGLVRLREVRSFFHEYSEEPVGEHLVLVCDGTACHAGGSRSIIQALEGALGINVGQTTADGLFTLRKVGCLGSCGSAPVMVVDAKTYARVRLTDASQIARLIEHA
ncbi:NAD(P)H-dependent oxidoreductase subunit E [Adlercreutzia sp. ZJ242]|uniref:NADH-quinone oxidoreductase subunit NuoE family protein n=1 Tax=Adlercreutzia sp. ZJ242 TaxID=2709409 RepID=UPI0013EADDDC|nr:NAD(P)H-dependent oxidoreductase subunit E [Adlercreutzia sp. ZJ242]